jgi:hypothetical protein
VYARDGYASSRPAASPPERYDDSRGRADAWDGAGFRGHEVPQYRPPAPPVRTTLEWHASTGWRERREPEPEPYQRPASPRRYRDDREALPAPGFSRHAHLLLPAPPPAARPQSPPPVQRDLQWERILEASQRAPLPPPPCPTWLDNSSRERTSVRPAASRFSKELSMASNDTRPQHGDDLFGRVPEPQSAPVHAVPLQEPRPHVDFTEPAAAEAYYVDSLDDAELEPKRQRLGWGQGLAHAPGFAADDAAQEQRQTTPPACVAAIEVEAFPLEQAEYPSEPKASSPQAPTQPLLPAEPEHYSSELAGASLISKSDVLCEIDRVDADITDLEARLGKLREADLDEDEELAEDAAARLPPPRPRPRRPLLPHVFDTPLQHNAAADAFSATPAAAVLTALGPVVAAFDMDISSTGNAVQAVNAAEALGLLPFSGATMQPFDSAALLARNAVAHAELRDRVALYLARHSAARREAKASLALEYCQKQARWVTGLAAYTDTPISLPVLAPADGTSELAAERAEERERTHARLPAQLHTGAGSSMRVFPSRNALVQAPATTAFDEARVRPWSAAERRTFLDKFSLYGKDFARIATHLAARSTADCVVYYYRAQKVDDGFGGKRKAALKKRRQYAAAAAMGFGAVAAFRDADAGRQRERAAPTAEARQEKAALAAAARAAALSKEKAARAGRGGGAKRTEREDAVPLTTPEVARVLDALPRTGKSFRALAAATGIAVPSLKSFWAAHRSTHGLEAIVAQAAGDAMMGDRGLSGLQGPGAADTLAGSSAPEMHQAAIHVASHVPMDVPRASASVSADAAEAVGADERVRHPLLSAVQFIRTHANAQPRDDAGDQLEAAAILGEAGAPVAEELEADEVKNAAAEFTAAAHGDGATGVDAVESDADAAENDAEDLSEDAPGSGGSISAPQGADAGVATAD